MARDSRRATHQLKLAVLFLDERQQCRNVILSIVFAIGLVAFIVGVASHIITCMRPLAGAVVRGTAWLSIPRGRRAPGGRRASEACQRQVSC